MKNLLKIMVGLVFITMLFINPVYSADEEIQLEWTQTISDDFAGWKVYLSTESNNYDMENPLAIISYTETQSSYTTDQIIQVSENTETIIYVVMSSFDISNNESGISNEVTKLIDLESPENPFILNIQIVTSP